MNVSTDVFARIHLGNTALKISGYLNSIEEKLNEHFCQFSL